MKERKDKKGEQSQREKGEREGGGRERDRDREKMIWEDMAKPKGNMQLLT